MRTIKLIFIIPCVLFVFSACQKDNYSGPDAGIFGALTDGQIGGPLQLSAAGANSAIRMIVNDPAKYPSPGQSDLSTFADGTYKNTRIFAENYKMLPLLQSGPWQYISVANPVLHPNGDTVAVNIAAGKQTEVNFKVNPFFYISTPVVADSVVTFTITKSTTTTVSNNLTTDNNVLILINNYPIVYEGISSNVYGKYYQNQFQYTYRTDQAVGAAKYYAYGTSITPSFGVAGHSTAQVATNPKTGGAWNASFPWTLTHLPKGTYYLRIAVVGGGSGGKYNYSPVVQFTVH